MLNRHPRCKNLTIAWLGVMFILVFGCSRSNDPSSKSGGAKDVASNSGSAKRASRNEYPCRFTDVLENSGITFAHHLIDKESGELYQVNPYDHGSGLCAADVNGDGLDDLYFIDFLGDNHLYINRGEMRFEPAASHEGISMSRSVGVGAAFGDYDNDGDQDLYATSYRGGNRLFRNKGDGTFDDVTDAAGVAYNGHSSSATWFDYDGDGDLDLYLCNIGKFTADTIDREVEYIYQGLNLMANIAMMNRDPENTAPGESNIMWKNEGDGRFTDVTKESGLGADGWNGDVTVSDYDLDGDPDVYVTNMFGRNLLYQNDGQGHFADVTKEALGPTSWGSVGARFFDGNGDAYPDLYVVDMHSDMWLSIDDKESLEPRKKYNSPNGARYANDAILSTLMTTPTNRFVFGNTYFENQRDGTFKEVSERAGLECWWPWGIAAADFNGDGHCDLYVPVGMGYPFFYWPNQLFVNNGKGDFREMGVEAGVEPPARGITIPELVVRGTPCARSSRAAAAADLDLDGDIDLVTNNFNSEPYLYRNDSPSHSYLQIRLKGTRSNRDAVGARVQVVTPGRTFVQEQVNSAGYLSQSSHTLHFGLGGAQTIERVEVFWPWSKEPQIVEAPKINTRIDIEQQ